MIKDVYNKFVEANLKGRVVDRHPFLADKLIPPSFGWAIPQFDFDHIDDPLDKSMWSNEEWDEYWTQGTAAIEADNFHLPYPECVYIFRFHQGGTEHINIHHLIETDDAISGEVYVFHPNISATWFRHPLGYKIIKGSKPSTISVTCFNEQNWTGEAMRYAELDVRSNYTKMIVGTLIMSRVGRTVDASDREPSRVAINNRMAKFGEGPLPDLVRVRRQPKIYGHRQSGLPTGNAVQPHFRRGHLRTLKSGRIVPVRPAAIHGGSDPARRYLIAA